MSNISLVRDIFNPNKMLSLICHEDEPIEKIIKIYAENPHLRGIFALDKNEKFIGVITRNDLLMWAKYKIGSGIEDSIYLKTTYDEIKRYALSHKISEMIHPNSAEAFVREDDNILKALRLMLDSSLIDVPVIDSEGKIIGDLKLTEILLNLINETSSCT